MAIISKRPITPSQRYVVGVRNSELSKERPVRSLTESKSKSGGRNTYGRITSRRRGGGHKRLYRRIDFKRDRLDAPAEVIRFEYDPNARPILPSSSMRMASSATCSHRTSFKSAKRWSTLP
jgi:large subunit ribosomal protein L2